MSTLIEDVRGTIRSDRNSTATVPSLRHPTLQYILATFASRFARIAAEHRFNSSSTFLAENGSFQILTNFTLNPFSTNCRTKAFTHVCHKAFNRAQQCLIIYAVCPLAIMHFIDMIWAETKENQCVKTCWIPAVLHAVIVMIVVCWKTKK